MNKTVTKQPRIIRTKTNEMKRESIVNNYKIRPSRGGCGCGNGGK